MKDTKKVKFLKSNDSIMRIIRDTRVVACVPSFFPDYKVECVP